MSKGTTVKNPAKHTSSSGYKKCKYCGLQFTELGISRHWDKCAKKKESDHANSR